jgi:hypothetical protein
MTMDEEEKPDEIHICIDQATWMEQGDSLRIVESNDYHRQEHGDGPMQTSMELRRDGSANVSMAGRPSQNEEQSLSVCRRLAEAMITADIYGGLVWGAREVPEGTVETGADGYVFSGDIEIAVQVVRAYPTPGWREVARNAPIAVRAASSVNEAVEQLWSTLEHKRTRASKNVILAIAAGQPGLHSTAQVIQAFRKKYGALMTNALGWREIWVVGYTPQLCHRLAP